MCALAPGLLYFIISKVKEILRDLSFLTSASSSCPYYFLEKKIANQKLKMPELDTRVHAYSPRY